MNEKLNKIKQKVYTKVDNIKQKIAVSKVVRKNKEGKFDASLELLVVVVNRGYGENVCAFLKDKGLIAKLSVFGLGTAQTSVESIFGLYSKEKDIVTSIIPIKNSDEFLDELERIFLKIEKHPGIAFTIPLKSISKNSLKEII